MFQHIITISSCLSLCFAYGTQQSASQIQYPNNYGSPSSSTPPNHRLTEVFAWKQMEFAYPNAQVRKFAMDNGDFVPGNINPIGVGASGSRVFVTMPRWRSGVPATLATVRFPSTSPSPLLHPYPDWAWNRLGNCDGITSVYRVKTDECNLLWVIDTGVANSRRICPAQIVAFDLATDDMVHRFRYPENVLREESLPGAIEVEYPAGHCGPPSTAVVYASDVTTFTLLVADLSTNRAWRVRHRTMFPSANAAIININDESLELMDGIVGLALSPPLTQPQRELFYNPLSGYRQHWVRTDVLRNETRAMRSRQAFMSAPELRPGPSQSVGCTIDKNGVLFFGLLNSNALACWATNKPYTRNNVVTLARDDEKLQYTGTVFADQEGRLWVMSARVHKFFLGSQNPHDFNFRVFLANSSTELVRGTACEHNFMWLESGSHRYQRNRTTTLMPDY
ncbi:hypothetical protein B566_EDAN002383 [Ephemera danica]|nr:hypothetical protein B566_EDAN002383 [Ephemera danica]